MEQTVHETVELLENYILEESLALNKRTVHEKDEFLLSDLLEHIKPSSELNRLVEPTISDNLNQ